MANVVRVVQRLNDTRFQKKALEQLEELRDNRDIKIDRRLTKLCAMIQREDTWDMEPEKILDIYSIKSEFTISDVMEVVRVLYVCIVHCALCMYAWMGCSWTVCCASVRTFF